MGLITREHVPNNSTLIAVKNGNSHFPEALLPPWLFPVLMAVAMTLFLCWSFILHHRRFMLKRRRLYQHQCYLLRHHRVAGPFSLSMTSLVRHLNEVIAPRTDETRPKKLWGSKKLRRWNSWSPRIFKSKEDTEDRVVRILTSGKRDDATVNLLNELRDAVHKAKLLSAAEKEKFTAGHDETTQCQRDFEANSSTSAEVQLFTQHDFSKDMTSHFSRDQLGLDMKESATVRPSLGDKTACPSFFQDDNDGTVFETCYNESGQANTPEYIGSRGQEVKDISTSRDWHSLSTQLKSRLVERRSKTSSESNAVREETVPLIRVTSTDCVVTTYDNSDDGTVPPDEPESSEEQLENFDHFSSGRPTFLTVPESPVSPRREDFSRILETENEATPRDITDNKTEHEQSQENQTLDVEKPPMPTVSSTWSKILSAIKDLRALYFKDQFLLQTDSLGTEDEIEGATNSHVQGKRDGLCSLCREARGILERLKDVEHSENMSVSKEETSYQHAPLNDRVSSKVNNAMPCPIRHLSENSTDDELQLFYVDDPIFDDATDGQPLLDKCCHRYLDQSLTSLYCGLDTDPINE